MMKLSAVRRSLMCKGPTAFEVELAPRRQPAANEIEVEVAAASVNPIDARRAEGYGRRLLTLLGAGRLPIVLGNDFAGMVTAVGSHVGNFKPGDCVFGVKPTSAEGTHASHVIVKATPAQVRIAPGGKDLRALAALPYSFVTMWLAVRGIGLTKENAAGKSVLVHGAAGGLGTLALQMLSAWGARITAIAKPSSFDECRKAGAAAVVDSTGDPFASLKGAFDATINFASWEDDLAMLGCLREGAFGHATTVHPLLRNFDEFGWLRGALRTLSDKRRHRTAMPKGARNYRWTVFKPEEAALTELSLLIATRRVGLPIGVQTSLDEAAQAFAHVRERRRGRALLLP
jgi:NADPH:quinone reductase-like Zn-dependent oxidoreductase